MLHSLLIQPVQEFSVAILDTVCSLAFLWQLREWIHEGVFVWDGSSDTEIQWQRTKVNKVHTQLLRWWLFAQIDCVILSLLSHPFALLDASKIKLKKINFVFAFITGLWPYNGMTTLRMHAHYEKVEFPIIYIIIRTCTLNYRAEFHVNFTLRL